MTRETRIARDFDFVRDDEEIARQAPRLRYVAALNPDFTKKEFVAAAVAAGYNPDTAAIQFANSRRFSLTFDDVEGIDAEGRLIEKVLP